MDKRKTFARVLARIQLGIWLFFDAFASIHLDSGSQEEMFLRTCHMSLQSSIVTRLASLFDKTKGTISIEKYLVLLDKGNEKDKDFAKEIRKQLKNKQDIISRIENRRNTELAHTNLDLHQNLLEEIEVAGEVKLNTHQITEIVQLSDKIIRAIGAHEGFNMNETIKKASAAFEKEMDESYKRIKKTSKLA